MLGAAWPEDEICKDVGVRPPVRCPVRGPFCPLWRCRRHRLGKVPKCYAKGQKGTDSSLYAVQLLQSYYLHKLARKNRRGRGGGKRLPWRRSRIVGTPRAKWKLEMGEIKLPCSYVNITRQAQVWQVQYDLLCCRFRLSAFSKLRCGRQEWTWARQMYEKDSAVQGRAARDPAFPALTLWRHGHTVNFKDGELFYWNTVLFSNGDGFFLLDSYTCPRQTGPSVSWSTLVQKLHYRVQTMAKLNDHQPFRFSRFDGEESACARGEQVAESGGRNEQKAKRGPHRAHAMEAKVRTADDWCPICGQFVVGGAREPDYEFI